MVVHTSDTSTQGLRQEDHKFEARLGCIMRLCQKERDEGRERERERERRGGGDRKRRS